MEAPDLASYSASSIRIGSGRRHQHGLAAASRGIDVCPQSQKSVPAGKPKAAAATQSKKTTSAKGPAKRAKAAPSRKSAAPREGSKTAQVVALLLRKNGAALAEIMDQMGWQKHTVRGFMAGAMKKAGYTVESFKSDKGERTYRINP